MRRRRVTERPPITPEQALARCKGIIKLRTIDPDLAREIAHYLLGDILESIDSGMDPVKLGEVARTLLPLID